MAPGQPYPSTTASPPPGARPTGTAIAGTCPGDCNRENMVLINELILGVNIALGRQPVSTCVVFDRDGDAMVVVNELVAAVAHALAGCAI